MAKPKNTPKKKSPTLAARESAPAETPSRPAGDEGVPEPMAGDATPSRGLLIEPDAGEHFDEPTIRLEPFDDVTMETLGAGVIEAAEPDAGTHRAVGTIDVAPVLEAVTRAAVSAQEAADAIAEIMHALPSEHDLEPGHYEDVEQAQLAWQAGTIHPLDQNGTEIRHGARVVLPHHHGRHGKAAALTESGGIRVELDGPYVDHLGGRHTVMTVRPSSCRVARGS